MSDANGDGEFSPAASSGLRTTRDPGASELARSLLLRAAMVFDRNANEPWSLGHRVRFRVADAFLPESAALLDRLTEEVQLVGTVVGFSDRGPERSAFVVVEVMRSCTAIVPVEALTSIEAAPGGCDRN